MAWWERAFLLALLLDVLLDAVLTVCITFPFGVWGRMWNSIVSVPDHRLFFYFIIDVITCDASSEFVSSSIPS